MLFLSYLILDIIYLNFLFHVYGRFACIYICTSHASLVLPEAGVGSPGTMVRDVCEPSRGYWKLRLGPPEEESVLLATEPSLRSLDLIFIPINIVYCYYETQLHFLELVWSFQVLKNVLIGSREALRLSLNVSCC